MDKVVDTPQTCVGLLGDKKVWINGPVYKNVSVFVGQLLKAVTFEREWYAVRHVEPGAFPLNAHHVHVDLALSGKIYHTVSAYRCTLCRTLFIVPRVEDLAHKCTEPFDQEEVKKHVEV